MLFRSKLGRIYLAQFLLRRLGNGKTICLGQKEMTGEGGKDYNFFYEAISIKPTTLNDSIFAFPSNFSVEVVSGKIRKSEAISDTVNTVPKHKRKSSKKSPSKNTHNQPTKSSAIKQKE